MKRLHAAAKASLLTGAALALLVGTVPASARPGEDQATGSLDAAHDFQPSSTSTLSPPPASGLSEQLKTLKLPHTQMPSADAMARHADIVIFGHLHNQTAAYPTSTSIGSHKLYHYVQTIAVRTMLSGGGTRPPSTVKLVTDGVEPLPPASDPLNQTYTGPLAEGDYVFFLRRVPGTELYALPGGWQALYPVQDGRLIALQQQGGFSAYHALTVRELQLKLQTASAAPPSER
ncbi:hypothetical protein WMW72_10905 [Paenibacillus filicis]|uniref:Uncharacterized protein n=1 Tax=Paenibacillus filicis TaxID=669464 RepID=A0ABU9DKW2_9BACL